MRNPLALVAMLSVSLPAQSVDTLGLVSGEPVYTAVSSVAVDPRGRWIFVADPLEHAVFVLDTLGKLVQRIGRRGKGPGEFESPAGLAVSPDGVLWVRDITRVQLFRPAQVGGAWQFQVASQFAGPPFPDWTSNEPSYTDDEGNYYYPHRQSSTPRVQYFKYSSSGAQLGALSVPDYENHPPIGVFVPTSRNGGKIIPGLTSVPFAALPAWAVSRQGHLLASDGRAYLVEERSIDGHVIARLSRTVTELPIPARIRTDSTRALRERLNAVQVPLDLVRGLPAEVRDVRLPASFAAVVDVLSVGRRSRVVRRWADAASPEPDAFDVFRSDGRFVRTVRPDPKFARRPQVSLSCAMIVGVVLDRETGVQYVVRASAHLCDD